MTVNHAYFQCGHRLQAGAQYNTTSTAQQQIVNPKTLCYISFKSASWPLTVRACMVLF